ncbi:MAG: GatB/YqeY domain-containing protein, partial [Dehalococcoidia bacterium]
NREVKQHRDSISEFGKANRQDLVSKEEAELAILMEYLPQQMSKAEITAIARQVIEETKAQGPRDKGKVMSKLMPQLKGKAEGQLINETVNQLLGGP